MISYPFSGASGASVSLALPRYRRSSSTDPKKLVSFDPAPLPGPMLQVVHRFVGRQVHSLGLGHAVGNVLGLALTEVIDHRVAHVAQELRPMVLGMRLRP